MISTIAVTGGTGFVGREVIRQLLANGYHVKALVRSEDSKKKLPSHSELEPIIGDPCHSEDILKILDGAEALIHLVGTRRKEMKRTGKTYEDIDLGSAIAAADAMKRSTTKRILFLSAADIGNSIYVQCKRKAEAAIRNAGLEWTIWRPSFILGEGQEWPRIFAPFLALAGLFGGSLSDTARRAKNTKRSDLAKTFVLALKDTELIHKVLDVPAIAAIARKPLLLNS
jgi:NADH dehydrogenase